MKAVLSIFTLVTTVVLSYTVNTLAHPSPPAPGDGYIHLDQTDIDPLVIPSAVSNPEDFYLGTFLAGATVGGAAEANKLDGQWIQTETSPAIWDLGGAIQTVYIFPYIDHGPTSPIPYEAIEFTVWGANDPNAQFPDNWMLASLQKLYKEGWTDTRSSDDWVSQWTFERKVRYIAVYANYSIHLSPESGEYNQCLGQGEWCSFDAEVDAVGIPPGVPALSQWGWGLLLFGFVLAIIWRIQLRPLRVC